MSIHLRTIKSALRCIRILRSKANDYNSCRCVSDWERPPTYNIRRDVSDSESLTSGASDARKSYSPYMRYDDAFYRQPRMVQINPESEGFDPRYDDHHFKRFQREESKRLARQSELVMSDDDTRDSRAAASTTRVGGHNRPVFDSDYFQEQRRIIEENKQRWKNRAEPVREVRIPSYNFGPPKASRRSRERRETPREKEDRQLRIAEDYSKRRRANRMRELERQAKELHESRKRYRHLLPKTEASFDRSTEPNAATREKKTASQIWLEKKDEEAEAPYWHSWHTCPDERRLTKMAHEAMDWRAEPDDEESEMMRPYDNSRERRERSLTQPRSPYDSNSRRRYQTVPRPSLSAQMAYDRELEVKNSLEDLHHRAKQISMDFQERPMRAASESMLRRPPPTDSKSYKMRMSKSMSNKEQRRVEPPRYRLTVSKNRIHPPMKSFSEWMRINTGFIPQSEYIGYTRPTVCDRWHNFVTTGAR